MKIHSCFRAVTSTKTVGRAVGGNLVSEGGTVTIKVKIMHEPKLIHCQLVYIILLWPIHYFSLCSWKERLTATCIK